MGARVLGLRSGVKGWVKNDRVELRGSPDLDSMNRESSA
jgi:hypothetical protein